MEESSSRRVIVYCDSCRDEPYKYTCPGCARKSCSVKCVKRHKLENGCTGERCKTGYVRLSDFDDNQLLSDYYFLEDVSRRVDSAHRDHFHKDRETKHRHQRFHWLRVHAGRRFITLLSQPPGMTKHNLNTSKTVHSTKNGWSIYWKVDLVFPQAAVDFQEKSVPEDTKLGVLLNRYIHPTDGDPIVRHRLRPYVQNGGVDGVQVFLKDERSKFRLEELDVAKSIRDNLQHKTVIEYPTLVIVKKGMRDDSNIDGSDLTTERGDSVVTKCDESSMGEEGGTDSPRGEECGSDWSDFEEGEIKDNSKLSSLGLIAQMYS